MAQPSHIYSSTFSRRERTRRVLKRRLTYAAPMAFGGLTGAALLALTQVAPNIVGALFG